MLTIVLNYSINPMKLPCRKKMMLRTLKLSNLSTTKLTPVVGILTILLRERRDIEDNAMCIDDIKLKQTAWSVTIYMQYLKLQLKVVIFRMKISIVVVSVCLTQTTWIMTMIQLHQRLFELGEVILKNS